MAFYGIYLIGKAIEAKHLTLYLIQNQIKFNSN